MEKILIYMREKKLIMSKLFFEWCVDGIFFFFCIHKRKSISDVTGAYTDFDVEKKL